MDATKYNPITAWRSKLRNVRLNSAPTVDNPATFKLTIEVEDSQEIGAGIVDDTMYLTDFVGVPFKITNVETNNFTKIDYNKEVLLIDINRVVYLYSVDTKTIKTLFTSVGYGDIASTNSKIIVGNYAGNGSTEYEITLNPYTISQGREFTFGLGNSYCYIDENTLITGSYSSLSLLDMSVTPPTNIGSKTIPLRYLRGDILYNPYDDIFIVSTSLSNYSKFYLSEHRRDTFAFIKEIEINLNAVMGMFVYSSVMYVTNVVGNNTNIYKYENGMFELFDTLLNKQITGASQSPEYCNIRL